ncbi:hypothetical protein ACFSSA_06200 [Luteolibacter algae]|uniref:AsmA-like C-terminal domain-containing protein n=1 Tax=Luteolibacter algae TaxID=454151 RepID=A0ABW5D5X3_9BACT
MSDSTTEPEKYSIDEMMERLKPRDPSEGKGELVTRADGSQAMRVKKRKRRTKQGDSKESKRNQRLQLIQISGFVVLLVLAGLLAGIAILYANSSAYRDGLLSKAEANSGAKVSFNQFRMNPATANSNQVMLDWPAGNALSTLDVRGVVAKIAPASFLGKVFKGEEIVAANGELILQAPSAEEPTAISVSAEGIRSVDFSRYSIPLLNVFFGKAKLPDSMLEATEASLYPGTHPGRAEVRLSGGMLKLKGWPELALDRSYIKIRAGQLDFQSLRLMKPQQGNNRRGGRGHIDFSGGVKPLDAGAKHTLSASVEDFSLAYILGGDLGRFFMGDVVTNDSPDSNFLTFDPNSPDTMLLELNISNSVDSRIDISQFKFLSYLALALEDRWYELPGFESEATAMIRREGNSLMMSDIRFEQRGRMALRGSIKNKTGGGIEGQLDIGIPETTIGAASNKRLDQLFGEVREGYRWVSLDISGTSAVPADNFRELYESAENKRASDKPAISDPAAPDSFESLIDQ